MTPALTPQADAPMHISGDKYDLKEMKSQSQFGLTCPLLWSHIDARFTCVSWKLHTVVDTESPQEEQGATAQSRVTRGRVSCMCSPCECGSVPVGWTGGPGGLALFTKAPRKPNISRAVSQENVTLWRGRWG